MFKISSFNQLISSIFNPICCVVNFVNQHIKNIAKAIFTPMLALPNNAKSLLNRVTLVGEVKNKPLETELLEWKSRLPENQQADANTLINEIMKKGINTTFLKAHSTLKCNKRCLKRQSIKDL